MNYEIWILGDLNVDLLRRDGVNTVKLLRFAKNFGLGQLIKGITRPNKRGGSCLDVILTYCIYVKDSGILDDFVSDHYTVYCVRKKDREHRDIITRTVRDYSRFDENNFGILLVEKNWDIFNVENDPDAQWEILLEYVQNILAIMCPYKRVHTRKKVTPWLTQEIYKAIRDKKTLIKKYKQDKDPETLKMARTQRNLVNRLVNTAKSQFILDSLHANAKKTKKFWKIIKGLIDSEDCVDITSYAFCSRDNNPV